MAKEVAKPLSQAISGISGVTKVRASSTNGLANLTVEWEYGLDNDELVTKIRTAADSSALPDPVEYDVVAGSTDDIPVLVLGIASDASLNDLAQKVDEQVIPELAGTTGVRQVQVSGQDTTELVVTLRPDRLRRYDLTAAAVTQALQSQATVIPAGNSFNGDTELAIQVGETPTTAKQVAGWSIPAADGPVKVASVADVAVDTVEATTIARSDGRPALSATILKESDADSVELSHTVRDKIPALVAGLGDNASIQVVFDQAPSIEQSIHDLAIEGGLGLTFAILIILVFLLSVRSTIITAISIPLSLLIAIIGLQAGRLLAQHLHPGRDDRRRRPGGRRLDRGGREHQTPRRRAGAADAGRDHQLGQGGGRRGHRVDADHRRGLPAGGRSSPASPASCSGRSR